MASRQSTKILAALKGKGFVDTGGDHHWLVLCVGGKKTSVRTKVSRGGKDYGDGLLGAMKKQLHLDTKRDLLDLVDCPMSGSELVRVLQEKGILPQSITRE